MACGITNINYEGICIIFVDPNPLGISTKLQKVTVVSMISVCPSIHLPIRMEQLSSHWTGFHESWYSSIFQKSVEKIEVSLKSDKNNGYMSTYVLLW